MDEIDDNKKSKEEEEGDDDERIIDLAHEKITSIADAFARYLSVQDLGNDAVDMLTQWHVLEHIEAVVKRIKKNRDRTRTTTTIAAASAQAEKDNQYALLMITKKRLFEQIEEIDFEHFVRKFLKATAKKKKKEKKEKERFDSVRADNDNNDNNETSTSSASYYYGEEERERMKQKAYELITEGKVCAICLAGGEGSRLASLKPKGLFDIGLPSKKSLFQLQAERLRKLKELAFLATTTTTTAAAAEAIHMRDDDDVVFNDDKEEEEKKEEGEKEEEEKEKEEKEEEEKEEEDVAVIKPSSSFSHANATISLPWYIMTSSKTNEETVKFFEENNYFELPKSDVIFFQQEEAPVFDLDGKIVIAKDGTILTAPDGNGSIYRALLKTKTLLDMQRRQISHIHCYSVDNALIIPGDPEFVGFCAMKGNESGAKVIEKKSPEEKVGVFAREILSSVDDDDDNDEEKESNDDDGIAKQQKQRRKKINEHKKRSIIRVLEYSEIDEHMRDEREEVDYEEILQGGQMMIDHDDPKSKINIEKYNKPPWNHFNPDNRPLRFRCANIAIHYFTLDFLHKVCEIATKTEEEEEEEEGLDYHVAEKSVSFFCGFDDDFDNENDDLEKAASAHDSNERTKKAIKLESFIFDAYKFSTNGVTIFKGERKRDFAPVKNARGEDSPESARAMISFLHATWLARNQCRVQWGGYGGLIEVSPLVSLFGENLEFLNDCDLERNVNVDIGFTKPQKGETIVPWHRFYGKHSSKA